MGTLLFTKIKEILSREDTILFIGAGVSRWSGLPSWYGLLEELAEFVENQGYPATLVRKELQNNDLLQAASYGVDKLSSSQFGQFIKQVCRVGKANPHDIHYKIVNLGPKCFITTNYDRLLEESLAKWRTDQYFDVVSNKQPIEAANIVQARATNFVFKPHGDVNDVESVILSREQYRILHGDRIHALKSLETLLVSRPVIFIGFGLRDLDFFYVKEVLLNTYKGGTIDHYAIMADVTDDEREHWRKNYGIHILTYQTTNNGSDHSSLLKLLDELLQKPEIVSSEKVPVADRTKHELLESQVFAIARYAARLSIKEKITSDIELPLEVITSYEDRHKFRFDNELPFGGVLIDEFLEKFSKKAILLGLPGAGKTYALKKSCSKIAEKLQKECLDEQTQQAQFIIPIYLDLKLYKGDLWAMAEQSLPPEISLESLIENQTVKIFIDSFNEMPKEFFESGEYEKDFINFLERVRKCSVIIGSRTEEGLQKFELPIVRLEEINEDFVKEFLVNQGHSLTGIFKNEVVSLLQKPLFFKLFSKDMVTVNADTHPAQIYKSFFQKLSERFAKTYGTTIPIEEILSPIAFEAIDDGQETLLFHQLQSQIKYSFEQFDVKIIEPLDFINWLISRDILVPAAGQRLTLFHQSVTEYLAASELAKRYDAYPQVLEKNLRFTRWDQTLFLALGFLNEENTEKFIQQVLEMDLNLAIRAARFLEFERDNVVLKILQKVNTKFDSYQFGMGYLLDLLPVTTVHIEVLKNLVLHRNSLGAAAFKLLSDVPNTVSKIELIEEIFSHPQDFNYCCRIGEILSSQIDKSDILYIKSKLQQKNFEDENTSLEDDDIFSGLTSGLTEALKNIEIKIIIDTFNPWQDLNKVALNTLCNILYRYRSSSALEMILELVGAGIQDAIFPLHMQIAFEESVDLNLSLFNETLLDSHLDQLPNEKYGVWAVENIRAILKIRPDLSTKVKVQALQEQGVIKLALLYCLPEETTEFWSEFSNLLLIQECDLDKEPLFLFEAMRAINWKEKEETLFELLKSKNTLLARHLLEPFYLKINEDTVFSPGLLTPVENWLEWLKNEELKKEVESYWFCDRLGNFLIDYSTEEIHSLFIDEFNKKNTEYREILSLYILPGITELNTDRLNEDAIQYLLSTLNQKHRLFVRNSFLGSIATESFVEERLLTLLSNDSEPFKSNLKNALKTAGELHRRRYIPDSSW
ncbi:MAG: SIR2 family protein [Acidobacteriota bacterium]|nr:SIR2 family protein [Acidobacteriota bacterium]